MPSKPTKHGDDASGSPRRSRPDRSAERRIAQDSDHGNDQPHEEGRESRRGAGKRDSARGEGRGSARPSEGRPQKSSRSSRPTKLSGPLDVPEVASDRPAQIAGEIRRALQAEIARGLNDPRVQGMISITEVVVTPDLTNARIRVSVLPETRGSLTVSGLRAAAAFLRKRLMVQTRISRVPQLQFELDDRLKRESALDSLLRAASSSTSELPVEGSVPDDRIVDTEPTVENKPQ